MPNLKPPRHIPTLPITALAAAAARGHDRPAEFDPFEPFANGSFGVVHFPGSSGNIVAVHADPMRSLRFSGLPRRAPGAGFAAQVGRLEEAVTKTGNRPWRDTATGIAVCLMAMLSGCPVARAQLLQPLQPPKILSLDDGHGILQALREGDAERLDAIRKEPLPPSMQDFANAAYFRALFRLKISSEYAQKCYDYGMQPSVLDKNPVIATVCGQVLAGNFNMEGDVANWAKVVVETRRAVLPVFQRITGRSDVIPSGLTGVPAEPFIGTAAANRVFPANDVAIPRVDPEDAREVTTLDTKHFSFANVYLVAVNINGVDRIMTLDTGSSITVLRPSTAHALGIEANPSPYLHLGGSDSLPARPRAETADQPEMLLGIADKMRIGTGRNAISLKGFPVAIGGDFDVLGMNVLSRMDSLYITAKGATANMQRPPFACEDPLEVASDPQGAYIPLLRYSVDGVAQQVAFDSGSTSYLMGTSLAPTTRRTGPDVLQKHADIAGAYEGSYIPVRATLGAGSSSQTRDIRVFPGYKVPYRYVLGVKALKNFN